MADFGGGGQAEMVEIGEDKMADLGTPKVAEMGETKMAEVGSPRWLPGSVGTLLPPPHDSPLT